MKKLLTLLILISSFAYGQKLPAPTPTPVNLSTMQWSVSPDSSLNAYSGAVWTWWKILSKYQADKLYAPIGSGGGYVPQSRTLTINGTAFDLSANRTWNVGTVTSIGLTSGTGISIGGTSPITGSGSFSVTNTAPDQTVVLNNGTGISVTGTYPNFTITNTSPGTGTVTSVTAGYGLTPNTSQTTAVAFRADTANLQTVANFFPKGDTRYAKIGSVEVPLTFSTGLTRTTNTITNNLSTGVSGGQTVTGSISTNSGLTYKATTGVGTTGADHIFKVGNNGANEIGRFVNNTSVVFGSTMPNSLFDRSFTIVNDAATSALPTRAGFADFKLQSYNNGNAAAFSNLQISTNRGTEGSHTFPQTGDIIGSVYFGSNRPATDEFYSGPLVQAYATENWVYNTNRGSKLVLGAGVQGTWVGSNIMVLGSNENVGIGNGVTESNYKLGVFSGDIGVGNNTPTTFSGFNSVQAGGDSGSSMGGIFSTRYNGTDAVRLIGTGSNAVINEPRNLPLEIRTNGTVGLTQLENQNVTSVGTITAPTFIGNLSGNNATLNSYLRVLSAVPNFTGVTGTSLESFYITGDDMGRIQAYDRTNSVLKPIGINGTTTLFSLSGTGTRMVVADNVGVLSTQAIPGGGGGSVTGVAVANSNGFAGTSDGNAVVPTLTLTTTINSPLLAGNGTAISAATTTGTGSTAVLSASPALTGTPTAPTATAGTNTTQIATTAFVNSVSSRQLEEFYTDVSTSGTSETDFYTYTIPAGTMASNGDKINAVWVSSYSGTIPERGYYINGTKVLTEASANTNQEMDIFIIRTGATTARVVFTNAGSTPSLITDITGVTWSGTVALKFTGKVATGTMTAKTGTIEFKPVAP